MVLIWFMEIVIYRGSIYDLIKLFFVRMVYLKMNILNFKYYY